MRAAAAAGFDGVSLYFDEYRAARADGWSDADLRALLDDHGVAVAELDGVMRWLPDDEAKAMQIVELLLAAGGDPSAKSKDGRTAADWARRRGMRDVAARLETAAATSRRP